MPKNLVSKSDFATKCGISRAAVSKACKKLLKAALVGERIDAGHPDAIEYANRTDRGKPQKKATRKPSQKKDPIATQISDQKETHIRGHAAKALKKIEDARAKLVTEEQGNEDDPQWYLEYTLREIIDKHGSETAFFDWLKAVKAIEEIEAKRIANAAAKGRLISRELVLVGVIDPINSAHLRMLQDGAKSITAGVISKHSGGADLPEIEAFTSDIIGSFIVPVKAKIARVIKDNA